MSTKLLTIDDCKITRQTVVNSLRLYDCIILEAEDGEAGLALASQEKPDLILLDYKMPVLDGPTTLARLRMDPGLRQTPVIMLTAEATRESVLKIARLGVRDYLLKPFQTSALVSKVNRITPLRLLVENKPDGEAEADNVPVLVAADKPAVAA